MATAGHAPPFEDFDDASVFDRCLRSVERSNSLNFVLDFDKDRAVCALDVDASTLGKALRDRDERLKSRRDTRWINIEQPERQSDAIVALADKYGFSNRLRSSMLSHPLRPEPQATEPSPHSSRTQELKHPRTAYRHWKDERRRGHPAAAELEKQVHSDDDAESPTAGGPQAPKLGLHDLNHYRIVSDVWQYVSVDWGYDYMCIGFNSLFRLRVAASREQMYRDKPHAKRVWTWLVLCGDGTVVSIRENAYPDGAVHAKGLRAVRGNLLNVLRQLSQAQGPGAVNQVTAVQIRAGLQPTSSGEQRVTDDESASLLLYYLFDDWYTSYGVIARSENQYGPQLDRVRNEMFQSAKIDHVHELHYYGRQLSILKRLYKSYSLVIERVIKGPPALTLPSRGGETNGGGRSSSAAFAEGLQSPPAPAYGVGLAPAALGRFERLRDRITLYALSEIDACLEEKESLMNLNFNLITIKESSYIERLTRITILLAKISLLFIPVTFVSTYFTIPFAETEYTPAMYWIAFAVIFALSFVGIVVFGRLSGTQEGKPIYQSLTQVMVDKMRPLFTSRKRKSREQDQAAEDTDLELKALE